MGTVLHYYQHNIGDYARDTGHLSILEHGIYRLLLDWCYLNEKPITTEQAMRVGRGNPVETQSVLSEFFSQDLDGWVHKRVCIEVQAYHAKVARNRQNGAKGGRPKPKNNPVGSQSEPKHNPNQEPITNNQYTPIPPKGAEERFERFWKAYPKKVGKDAARKSFDKRKPTEELLGKMLTAIDQQSTSQQWTRDGGQYIPNPATWLNQGRWQDHAIDEQPNPFAGGI
jgi:uncharacterized protein YdaU (DUF1376 family)